ncbi:MAG: single-stranded-DNA-specific exonuclease RecJ [Spirochaetaceae bacterium]|nr:MAG: single-stranded-DNA-specific exonuclease RecJ [Spirochaetaceae bacterium]
MIWEKSELNPEELREVARRYRLDLISAAVLIRRNYLDDESVRFILGDDPLLLHNPFLLQDMGKALRRIHKAVADGELIQIFGDRDVDGITSTILLREVLEQLGAKLCWQIPVGEDDYGLTPEVVDSCAAEGCGLLITVDCGISNNDEIARATELGIDTIVLDHHNPPEQLPAALAIIDPKCRESSYPFRDLSGCGVVAKLALALAYSTTPDFDTPVWFLNVQPANEAFTVQAVELVNMVESERIIDTVPSRDADLLRTRVYGKLRGQKVVVYDRDAQLHFLEQLNGEGAFELTDVKPDIDAGFPEFAGKSLIRIRELLDSMRLGFKSELDTLLELYRRLTWSRLDLQNVLEPIVDLAALGTIADLMPLVNENKIIVRRGLESMSRMKRSGLRELLLRQNLHGRQLTAKDISWHITPVLNSAGRMGQPQRAAELFLSNTQDEIETVIDAILQLNRQRKQLGDKIWNSRFPDARASMEQTDGKFVFVAAEDIPRGITGILAARLVSFFKIPAVVVSLGQNKAVGSLRSPYPANGFLDVFAEYFLNYGGHDRAAGFNLPMDLFEEFQNRFFQVARAYSPPDREAAKISIDAEVPPAYLNPELIKVVETFEPYGEGCPPLVFLTRGARIERLEIVGRQEPAHVKMLLATDRHKWPAVYWNAAPRAGKDFDLHDTVDIVFRLNRNYFMNTETLQLTILDLKR